MASMPAFRVREQPAGEEVAGSELKLGEFQHVPTLTLSEARLLINAVTSVRKSGRQLEDNEIFRKSVDYLNLFARLKNKDNIEAIEQTLSQRTHLHAFEKSQLANLGLGSEKGEEGYDPVSEAKALIPSLEGKLPDSELLELIEDLEKLKNSSGE